jgi:D-tyrosyl-tRNA(Tyr) deacylase
VRALVQRVTRASVTVDGEVVGRIGPGMLVLVCAMQGDTDDRPASLAAKVAKLRIFRDEDDRMNRSLADVGGAALVVSQFTLAADTSRGNRPGFSTAAAPELGERLYEAFADTLAGLGIETARGRFGADMAVELVNDGPVTIWLEN